MDQIKTQLDQLAELGDDQVAELQQQIISTFESVESEQPTPETVDAMTSLADALDTVRAEVSRREAQAEELAARASEASARVNGTEEPAMDETMPAPTPEEETPVEEPGKAPMDEDEKAAAPAAYSDKTKTGEASTVTEEGSELSTESTEATEVTEPIVEAAEVEAEAAVEEVVAEVPAADETVVASAEAEVEAETPAETIETQDAPEEQEEQAPVTAAAEQPFEAPADRQPVIEVVETPVAITAGADIPGYTAGTELTDMDEVASAMEKRLHSLRRVNGGDGEQHIVASFSTLYPDSRVLNAGNVEDTTVKIKSLLAEPAALTASGGYGGSLQTKYDIFGMGSTNARPVRDALPKFQADRGGIRFITPPRVDGSAYDNAVGVWTETLDKSTVYQNAGFSNVKGYLLASAAVEETATIDAVTLQIQFGNLATRAYPELISRHNELALVQHAREAEQALLAKIAAKSVWVQAHAATTDTSYLGVARDFLVLARKAAVAYRSRHRLDKNAPLTAIIPAWLMDAMAADVAYQAPGDDKLGISVSEVRGYFNDLNIDIVESLDLNPYAAQAGGVGSGVTDVLTAFIDNVQWYLFATGTFLFLDGGSLDLGIIRDSSLVNTNDYRMFIETFEGIAKVGIEALRVNTRIAVSGASAALVTPADQ